MRYRVALTGGGTGGHIYPALAIASALGAEAELLYLGSPTGIEARLAPAAGVRFVGVPSGGILGKRAADRVRSVWLAARGVGTARRALRAFGPQVVVGTGGYVAGPVCFAAWLLGVPVVILNEDAVPGLTNRLLARFARRLLVPHEAAARGFGAHRGLRVTGNPVREEVLAATREEGLERFGLDAGRPTVLVTTGSLGAEPVNRAVDDWLSGGEVLCQVIWATGPSHYARHARHEGPGVRVVPYLEAIGAAYAAADLVICRAGAMTLAEVTARGLPAILVPSPHVVRGHQLRNARAIEEGGAAVVIEEGRLTGASLGAAVGELLGDAGRREEMAARSLALGRPRALERIAGEIRAVIGEGARP